jgi:hypothetical protein
MPQGVQLFDKDGNVIEKLKIQLEGSGVMLPVDNQSNYQQTIQTHTGVTIPANGYVNGNWIDAQGFDKVALSILNDADVSTTYGVHWSHDGSGYHGVDAVGSTTSRMSNTLLDTKARYFRVYVTNKDTALAHTVSAWAYLKV